MHRVSVSARELGSPVDMTLPEKSRLDKPGDIELTDETRRNREVPSRDSFDLLPTGLKNGVSDWSRQIDVHPVAVARQRL